MSNVESLVKALAEGLVADISERVAVRLIDQANAAAEKEWLTPQQAAELLGQSVNTLQMLRSKRQGPPYVKLGRNAVRYKRQDLLAYLESDRRATVPRQTKKRGRPPKGAKK